MEGNVVVRRFVALLSKLLNTTIPTLLDRCQKVSFLVEKKIKIVSVHQMSKSIVFSGKEN